MISKKMLAFLGIYGRAIFDTPTWKLVVPNPCVGYILAVEVVPPCTSIIILLLD